MNKEQEEKVLNLIFDKWGKPDKITQTKVRFYEGWDKGGTKRGRIFIYHMIKDPTGQYERVSILSYFLKLHDKTLRLYIGNCNQNPDLVICL